MLFGILTVFAIQLLSAQGSFDVFLEDLVLVDYSKEYLEEPDIYVDDNHKIVFDLTLIKPFPSSAQSRVTLLGASMGEYVVDTGIDVSMTFCELIEEPILMGPFFQALGFDPNKCPPDAGHYGTDDYEFATDGLPDDFPPNTYRMSLDIFDEELKILVIHIFAKII